MSLPLKPIQVRLSPEAYAELDMIATVNDRDLGEVGAQLLTKILLGEGHLIRLAAERYSHAVAGENLRQRKGKTVNLGEGGGG